jgi:CRP-like cAMP-binding protein
MYAFVTSERFSALDAKDRDRLESLSKLDEFKAGQEILASGRPVEWLYLIASGGVDVRAKSPAGDVTLAQLGPGDVFGEVESFSELPEGVRHVARVDTIVRAVPKNPLMQELKAHRPLATGLLSVYCRSISEKVRATNEVAVRMGPQVPGLSRPPPPASASTGHPPHLSDEEASWIGLLGHPVELEPGTVVVEEGDTTRSFFIITSGACDVRKKVAGGAQARTLATLSAHDMFGFMAFVDGKPRSASVVTSGRTVLSRVEPDSLQRALHMNFTVSFKFLGTLCGVLGRTYRDTVRAVIAHS